MRLTYGLQVAFRLAFPIDAAVPVQTASLLRCSLCFQPSKGLPFNALPSQAKTSRVNPSRHNAAAGLAITAFRTRQSPTARRARQSTPAFGGAHWTPQRLVTGWG